MEIFIYRLKLSSMNNTEVLLRCQILLIKGKGGDADAI